ncbi:acyl-CoA dehydrogenase family protein, partial [Mycolicibacterium elephantis]
MARDSLNKRLARLRDGGESSGEAGGSALGGSGGMGYIVVSELCRVCMGVVTGMGVSLGLTVPTIMSRGTLAQQERWLPELVTYEKVGAWA